jgi:hypothetical protein
MGASPPISLTLSMINTFCLPSLMYGMEAICLTKKQIDNISYTYNAAFMKLFKSFDKHIIFQCQFYCSCLPLNYLIDLYTLNFYLKLSLLTSEPASILFSWFGNEDRFKINSKYNIDNADNSFEIKTKLWNCFDVFVKSFA